MILSASGFAVEAYGPCVWPQRYFMRFTRTERKTIAPTRAQVDAPVQVVEWKARTDGHVWAAEPDSLAVYVSQNVRQIVPDYDAVIAKTRRSCPARLCARRSDCQRGLSDHGRAG